MARFSNEQGRIRSVCKNSHTLFQSSPALSRDHTLAFGLSEKTRNINFLSTAPQLGGEAQPDQCGRFKRPDELYFDSFLSSNSESCTKRTRMRCTVWCISQSKMLCSYDDFFCLAHSGCMCLLMHLGFLCSRHEILSAYGVSKSVCGAP